MFRPSKVSARSVQGRFQPGQIPNECTGCMRVQVCTGSVTLLVQSKKRCSHTHTHTHTGLVSNSNSRSSKLIDCDKLYAAASNEIKQRTRACESRSALPCRRSRHSTARVHLRAWPLCARSAPQRRSCQLQRTPRPGCGAQVGRRCSRREKRSQPTHGANAG